MPTSALSLLLTATPSPSPSPAVKSPDPDLVTPGVAGFFVTFLLALVTILLIRSMINHLRKVRYSPDPSAVEVADAPAPRTPPAGDAPGRPRDDAQEPTTNGADR